MIVLAVLNLVVILSGLGMMWRGLAKKNEEIWLVLAFVMWVFWGIVLGVIKSIELLYGLEKVFS